MTVLECSTGNAGIGCSFVAAVKGYPCIIVMPEGMSEERKMLDIAYGSKMIYTPGGESDVDLALQKLEEIRSKDPGKYWVPAQFDNPDNIEAHFATTGPEIWEQTEGRFDAFIATQGTGGTLTGVGRYIRKFNDKVKLYAIEPAECPLLSKRAGGRTESKGSAMDSCRESRRLDAGRYHHHHHKRGDSDGQAAGIRGGHILRHIIGLEYRRGNQTGRASSRDETNRNHDKRYRPTLLFDSPLRGNKACRNPGTSP